MCSCVLLALFGRFTFQTLRFVHVNHHFFGLFKLHVYRNATLLLDEGLSRTLLWCVLIRFLIVHRYIFGLWWQYSSSLHSVEAFLSFYWKWRSSVRYFLKLYKLLLLSWPLLREDSSLLLKIFCTTLCISNPSCSFLTFNKLSLDWYVISLIHTRFAFVLRLNYLLFFLMRRWHSK